MRGTDTFTESPFTLHRLEDFVPANHPLRAIRQMVGEALGKMDELFAGMYEANIKGGRKLADRTSRSVAIAMLAVATAEAYI